MARVAAIIAIEHFLSLSDVEHALSDGKVVRECFAGIGFDIMWEWYNDEATSTKIDNFVNTAANELKNGDEFFLFYAGHGFWDKTNYLTAYDTVSVKPPNKAVILRPLIDGLQSKKVKAALFLDTCHSGLTLSPGGEDVFSLEEITRLTGKSEQFACFASCMSNQKSYTDYTREHGIWSHYLIEALSGRASNAMYPKPFITANSLQKYLHDSVSERARELKKVQSPFLTIAHAQEFFVGDLTELLPDLQPIVVAGSEVKSIRLEHYEELSIKQLIGFNSRVHEVPRSYTGSTRAFVAKIAERDVRGDVDNEFEKIKHRFAFTRLDMEVIRSDSNRQEIGTPLFKYRSSVEQNADDYRQATVRKEYLIKPQQASLLVLPEFEALAEKRFERFVLQLKEALVVQDIIDKLETAGIDVEYDADNTYATVNSADKKFSLTVNPEELIVKARKKLTPAGLLVGVNQILDEVSVSDFKVVVPEFIKELL